jgi:GNAT superfamily N-acetyltransferase
VAARVSEGIDAAWLDRLYREDPVSHALAVWDRLAWPEAISFLTLEEEGRPSAYLLSWNALPGCPVLHWLGTARDPAPLLARFPPPPFLAIVPPEVASPLRATVPTAPAYPIRVRTREPGAPPSFDLRPTRRLGAGDAAALRALALADGSTVTDSYRALDPARDWVVGGFDGPELVAVARAEVRLPEVWHISGVYTRANRLRKGWGWAVVARLLRDAAETGAMTGLFVREDNVAGQALYDRLGFRRGPVRWWVDAGADRPP